MQQVNMNKRTSDAYVGSIDTRSVADMAQLEEVRTYVKVMNKYLRDDDARDRRGNPLRYRVTVKGRDPIEKVNGKGYNWAGDIVGGMANAGRIDVYIHRRMDY